METLLGATLRKAMCFPSLHIQEMFSLFPITSLPGFREETWETVGVAGGRSGLPGVHSLTVLSP